MSHEEKLEQLKALLKITDTTLDSELAVYLSMSKKEILSWLYSGKTPESVTDVPEMYEPTQIFAVIAGYGLSGMENQISHSENSIVRSFKHSDMIAYIRSNVIAYARLV